MKSVPMRVNMTTPDFKHFLVFLTQQFFTSKRPGLNDFHLFSKMEEWWASEAHKIKIVKTEILQLKGRNIDFL